MPLLYRFLSKKKKLTSMNCGYALLTQNGETLQLSSRDDRFQQFQYQLYHYAAMGIKFQDTLSGKKVLDLCCGRGGGSKKCISHHKYGIVAFLSKHYEPSEAWGIDISAHQIATAQEKY